MEAAFPECSVPAAEDHIVVHISEKISLEGHQRIRDTPVPHRETGGICDSTKLLTRADVLSCDGDVVVPEPHGGVRLRWPAIIGGNPEA